MPAPKIVNLELPLDVETSATAPAEITAGAVVPETLVTAVAATVEAEPVDNTGRMIASVYGPMHDVLTGLSYDTIPCELLKDSLWIESQVNAGKLVFV